MGTAIIASFLTTTLWILGHLVAVHIRRPKNRMRAMAGAWLASFPVLVISLIALNHNTGIVTSLNDQEKLLLSWFYALLLYLLLFFLFVECFYHIERSVTLRLLVEIQAASDTKPSLESIMKDYSVDDMIRRRLDDMAQSAFITKAGDGWVLSPKAATLAKIMSLSCWIFQSKPQNERL